MPLALDAAAIPYLHRFAPYLEQCILKINRLWGTERLWFTETRWVAVLSLNLLKCWKLFFFQQSRKKKKKKERQKLQGCSCQQSFFVWVFFVFFFNSMCCIQGCWVAGKYLDRSPHPLSPAGANLISLLHLSWNLCFTLVFVAKHFGSGSRPLWDKYMYSTSTQIQKYALSFALQNIKEFKKLIFKRTNNPI